jgi:hypothetical protein
MNAFWSALVMAVTWVFDRAIEMVSDTSTGRLSHTKLATATGHLVGTYWFCQLTAEKGFILELWVVYFTVVIGHQQINKLQDIVAGIKAGR